jgi:hypothetical protein
MSCLGTDRLENIYTDLSKYYNSDINTRFKIERPEQELIAKFSECTDLYSKPCNELLREKELLEQQILGNPEYNNIITEYPNLNDPNFNSKIATKIEFGLFKYKGVIRDLEEYSNVMEYNNIDVWKDTFIKSLYRFPNLLLNIPKDLENCFENVLRAWVPFYLLWVIVIVFLIFKLLIESRFKCNLPRLVKHLPQSSS